MKRYLSLGAGVNSTALMLLLLDEGIEFETIFIDSGVEKPETYEYLDLLDQKGYEITTIIPSVEGFNNLYDYCWHWKIIPLRRYRICTSKFKTRPASKYVEKPCVIMLGYDINERKRKVRDRKKIKYSSPLIDRHITRQMCKKIIRDHGLPVPVKSGCWFCPFQSKKEWKKLRDIHPELFKKAMALEQNAQSRDPTKHLYRKKSLSAIFQENTLNKYLDT